MPTVASAQRRMCREGDLFVCASSLHGLANLSSIYTHRMLVAVVELAVVVVALLLRPYSFEACPVSVRCLQPLAK